jgi:Zn-dependent alcohol dehydrogenase
MKVALLYEAGKPLVIEYIEKRLQGTAMGSNQFRLDMPRLVDS